MATQPQQRSAGRPGAQAQAAAPPPRPFRVGVQSHEENNYDQTVTLTASTQDMTVFELPPQGFLQGIYLLVEMDSPNA